MRLPFDRSGRRGFGGISTFLRALPTLAALLRGSRSASLAGTFLVAGVGASCNLDPVHRAGVKNLGPERDDMYPPESEFHRPGEPCALCHSKEGPAKSEFLLAGTVFWGPDNYDNRVDNAYVRVVDANKTKKCFVTNCNGNFFVRPEDFSHITFPLLVSVERTKDPGKDETTLYIRRMSGHIGREPSCGTCHYLDPQALKGVRDFGSPGVVRLLDSEDQVKNANPPLTQACPKPADQPVITVCPEDR